MDIVNRVKEYIDHNRLLESGKPVLVGLSGGADSTALLKVLLTLGYPCTAVHCNFHLRGSESDRDQEFVENLCRSLGVELIICSYDTLKYASDHGLSIEMAARELRYADFERIMKERRASAVCIAHHRDDSVETVLLNLMRGTGIKGLTGIKPRNGHIIRPLLCVSRDEIEQWLREIGQSYVTDSTNLETDYTRNKIRLKLLPLMRDINPSVDEAILGTSNHLRMAYDMYIPALEAMRDRCIRNKDGIMTISIDALSTLPSVRGFLFEILSPLGFNETQIAAVSRSLGSQPGTRFLSPTHQIVKDRDSFIVSALSGADPCEISVSLEQTAVSLPDGGTLSIKTAPAGSAISASQNTATLDASLLNGSITIRRWREGDWFIPFGMKGRKLVSDYLTDCKVNPLERERQLVALNGNDIIWVMGRRSDNRYRVGPHTETQLILTLS